MAAVIFKHIVVQYLLGKLPNIFLDFLNVHSYYIVQKVMELLSSLQCCHAYFYFSFLLLIGGLQIINFANNPFQVNFGESYD